MHIAVFGSGNGTILRAMLDAQKKSTRVPFAIKALYTDRECGFQKIAEEDSLPLIYHPRKPSILKEEYDLKGLELLQSFSQDNKCPIDFLLLAGYMRLLSLVWLRAFPHRILNIHPADLTAVDEKGNRRFIGDKAVWMALGEGERKTRTSAILIDDKVDGGPILVSGPWTLYREGQPVDMEKAARHQEKQKAESDYPACLAALNLIAEGRVRLRSEEVFIDGRKMPPCGYELDKVQYELN